jgi:hypothetical protein
VVLELDWPGNEEPLLPVEGFPVLAPGIDGEEVGEEVVDEELL